MRPGSEEHVMQAIIEQILKDATAFQNGCHGLSHWNTVAAHGRTIALYEDLDAWFLRLFAYFHDCQRLSDGRDPEHGPRAADYVMTWTPEALEMSEDDQRRLAFACRYHTHERQTDDKTIRACWDCDRLDLGRVGIVVNPKFLFTETAKRIARDKPLAQVQDAHAPRIRRRLRR